MLTRLLAGAGASRVACKSTSLISLVPATAAEDSVTVMVLVAALPSASNVSMLAERYGANNGLVARIIMGSTTLAFITFTLWAWGFGVQPLH